MTLEGARILELHSSVSVASGMSHHGLARISILDTELDGSNPGSSMLFP